MGKLHVLVILLLAMSCNIDNIGVGLSYGTRRIKIPFLSNLLIAFITGAGTIIPMLIGKTIQNYLKPVTANLMGGLIIVGVGTWILAREYLISKRKGEQKKTIKKESCKIAVISELPMILENPALADKDFSGHISTKEGVLLGLALMLNNLANGIGAGMTGLNPVLTTIFVVLFSLLTIWFGLEMGHRCASRRLDGFAGSISGLILILIGIYEMIF